MKSLKNTAVAFFALMPLMATAQTNNFYATVANLWYQGHKAEVLALGQERLNANANDMPGLLINIEYELEFLQLDSISNTLKKVNFIGDSIANFNFKALYPSLKESNDMMLDFLTTYNLTPAELLTERAKGFISNKPFSLHKELEALQKDGLCEPQTQ